MKPTRIRPGVKAFIVYQGKALIVRERVMRNGQELIVTDLPGGGMEGDESVHEALHREVQEEVGLSITIERPVGCWDYVIEKETEYVRIVCLAYQCTPVGEPIIDLSKNPATEDIFETAWIPVEQLGSDTSPLDLTDMRLSAKNMQQLFLCIP